MRCARIAVERAASLSRLQHDRAHGALDDVAQLPHGLIAAGRVGSGVAVGPGPLARAADALVTTAEAHAPDGLAQQPRAPEQQHRPGDLARFDRIAAGAQDQEAREQAQSERADDGGAATAPGAHRVGAETQSDGEGDHGVKLATTDERQGHHRRGQGHDGHARTQSEGQQEDRTCSHGHGFADLDPGEEGLPHDNAIGAVDLEQIGACQQQRDDGVEMRTHEPDESHAAEATAPPQVPCGAVVRSRALRDLLLPCQSCPNPDVGRPARPLCRSAIEEVAVSLKEYRPGTTFPGVIGRTFDASEQAWPEPRRAQEGAPNVLFIVLDDTGFGQLGCYGSPIATPNLDRLAAGGVRYSNMHTTALCSPTRTCILTGRNHHSNHMAGITEISTGFPGYDGYIPFENGFLPEMLKSHGYNTYAVGKWHLTPADQISAAGPYDRWPLGRGFERYYGFLGGDTHQYYPELTYDNHRVEPHKTPEEGYHLTEDLVDHAIGFLADSKQVAPNKPFFLYFATGAMHAPHHVAKEWSDKYKGVFDDGWEAYREKVFARQKELGVVPADGRTLARTIRTWPTGTACSADERKLYARMMEVFAGFLEHTDHHIGRLLDFLEEIGELDNTLIMAISDNGASSEGGPTGSINENKFFNFVEDDLEQNLAAIDDIGGPKYFNHYPWGWTWAGNTPFRRWKRETYRGGISDPFIVHWPAGIEARGEVRDQYGHAIDMVPTVLELLGIEPPALHPGCAAVAHRGPQHGRLHQRRRGALAADDAVLRDARPSLDLPRRLEGGVPLAGHLVR